MTQHNGYKDPDQNLLSYALEMRLTVGGIANGTTGPVTALKKIKNEYQAAKASYIGTGILGATGLLAGIGIAGIFSPLAIAGALVVGMGAMGTYRSQQAVEFNDVEEGFFRAYPTILKALAVAIDRGLPSEVVVSIYEELLSMHSQNRSITPAIIQNAIAEKSNHAVSGYKASDAAATAFSSGQEMEVKYADDEDEYDDDENFDAQLGTPADPQAGLPPFLRSAAPDAESPKSSGVSAIAAAAPGGGNVAMLERSLKIKDEVGLPQALIDVAIDRAYSTFIIGMSAAGKDITLFNLVGGLKQKFPNSFFLGIDGKNHQAERCMWGIDLYDEAIHISMLDKPKAYHNKLCDALRRACEFPSGAIVAFSELNGIAGSYAAAGMKTEWGEIAHFLRYLALQGNASSKFLLSTAQGLTLDELGITTSARGNIQFMMLGNGSQYGFVNSITANTSVFDRKAINDQSAFIAACSRSTALAHLPQASTEIGIAYFHSSLNRWESMPRLFNPGVDRGVVPTEQPIPETDDLSIAYEAVARMTVAQSFKTPAIALQREVGGALIELIENGGLRSVLSEVKQYRELNQDRLAFALMISSILQSPSKTGFARLLGVTGGAKFQALCEFFDWAMGA